MCPGTSFSRSCIFQPLRFGPSFSGPAISAPPFPTNPIDFQGHMSKVKVTGPVFRIFLPLRDETKVRQHDNSWTVALSFEQLTCISATSRIQLNFKVILKGKGHIGFCVFLLLRIPADAGTCTLAISTSLLKYEGQRSHGFFFVFFLCVRDTVATRGQYLAVSKA